MPPKARGRSTNRTVNIFPPNDPTAEVFPDLSDGSDLDNDSAPAAPAPPAAPVIISPIKRRNIAQSQALSLNKKTDLAAWEHSDTEIINAAKASWRSEAYDHFNVSLQRDVDSNGAPISLTFIFTCKSRPTEHRVLLRPRSKTAEGTSNMVKTVKACLEAQGITVNKPNASTSTALIPYSPASHRALLALRCAKSLRPFNMITDEDYRREVAMLRPNTIIPNPVTVSRDINRIYIAMSHFVKDYFAKRNGTVHLVLDGWTSPLSTSYLGLVVVWYENGQIHRAILEFIRLTEKHDGRYLAQVVADCMKRFGLQDYLFSVCMDNATNCDKLAVILPEFLSSFPGAQGRLRCLAHIFNLIAKIFISFFFKNPKKKKTVRVAANTGSRGFRRPGEVTAVDEEEEIVLDEGDETDDGSDSEDNIAIEEEADASLEAADGDEGQGVHNERVVKSLREKAIQIMDRKGISMDPFEVRSALQIFPRIAGLARRVRDSSTIKERFEKIIADDPEIAGTQRALARRVPTRWNSELDCLKSHFFFHDVVQQLTAVSSLKLKAYRLSELQWKTASDVQEILLLFDDVTKTFSTAETPLVVDVIPTLEDLREGMIAARDDTENEISNIIRVACHASLLLIDKYSTFSDDCEIYLISIVMCPDRKMMWFKDHGRTPQQSKQIREIVIAKWKERYAPEDADEEVEDGSMSRTTRRSRYAPIVNQPRYPADHILTYLKEPLLPTSTIIEAGGYMKYWHQAMATRPNLARMASDYCSAPATSVDAERAFSTGRRQVNFMQHHMSSQTFKAQMAVGSWAKPTSPLNPGFKYIKDIIDKEIDNEENPFLNSEPAA